MRDLSRRVGKLEGQRRGDDCRVCFGGKSIIIYTVGESEDPFPLCPSCGRVKGWIAIPDNGRGDHATQ